jgi:hypothetical protein
MEIQNVTPLQSTMLDQMWEADTYQDLMDLRASLSPFEQRNFDHCYDLMIAELDLQKSP